MSVPIQRRALARGRSGGLALRVATAACLLVDVVVHVHLAPGYQAASPQGLGQGTLFLFEAAAAALAALAVLVRGSRPAYAFALLVSLSAFAAVMLYRYVDLPAFGPFPSMYDPVWFLEKSISAAAEGAGAVLAGLGLMRSRPRYQTRRTTGSP